MAARELRASWRRLLFFFVCVAIGVGAIVALRSVIQSVRAGLMREARALHRRRRRRADQSRPWTPRRRAAHRRAAARPRRCVAAHRGGRDRDDGAGRTRAQRWRGWWSCAPCSRRSRSTARWCSQDGAPYSHDLLRGPRRAGAARAAGAARHQQVGDRIVIGGQPFTIRGVIAKEPGAARRRLQPRFARDRRLRRAAARPGCCRSAAAPPTRSCCGSPDAGGRAAGAATCAATSANSSSTSRSYRATEDQIGEDLERAENYLSLVGFVIVVLGGIGVWSVTRVFVQQKIRSIAILKCLGATAGQVLAIYMLQVLLLGADRQPARRRARRRRRIAAIPASLTAAIGDISYGLTLSAVLQGLGVGLLVSLLFALVPLLEVRRVKPLLLLRGLDALPGAGAAGAGVARRSRGVAARIDWTQVGATVAVSAALVGVAAWQAASLRVGAIVSIGFAGVALVLHLAGAGLVRAVRPLALDALVPAAPRGHRPAAARATRPASSCWRSASAASSCSACARCRRTCSRTSRSQAQTRRPGHVPDRHPAGSGRCRCARSSTAGRSAPRADSGAARAGHRRARQRRQSRQLPGRARPRLARRASTSITYRDHLESNERVIDGRFWTGQGPLAADAPHARGLDRAQHPRALPDQRRRSDALRRARPRRSRHASPACARSSGRTRGTAASCSCSAPARSTARRTATSASCARRRTRPRAAASSATWSRGSRTSRRSTSARSWRRSRPCSTT